MDGLDWSKFQHQELEENLMIMPSSSNTLFYRDNYIPVQQVNKIDNSTPNLFPQWRSRSGGGAGGNWEASINAAGPLNSPFHYTNPQHGPILDPGPTSPQPTNLTSSFESIDCLLSASNQTDTTVSVEDDGISLIFSHRNTSLWNSNNNTNTHFKSSVGSLSENTDPGKDGTNRGTQHEKNPTINNQSTKRKRADQQKNHHFFQPISQKPKRPIPEKKPTNINFQHASSSAEASSADEEPDVEAIAHMKEIIYQAAAFRPVDFGEEETEMRPKRKNVRISSDPQTVAARERRERISERIRVLQRLVPGGSKMDTASMLDEAANYLKFLRSQVKALEALGGQRIDPTVSIGFPGNYANLAFAYSPYLNYPLGVMPMQQMQQPQFSIQGPNPVRKPESC